MTREVLTRQVIASGRITDALSGRQPRRPLHVRVVDVADGEAVDHVAVRVLPDASYALFGDPLRMLSPVAVAIRIEVEAESYDPASATLAFTAEDLARVTRSLTVAGETDEAPVIAALPRAQDVALTPQAVTLKGRVAQAEDPCTAITDASVSITAPAVLGPVLTNANGHFTLGPAPVAETVTLSVSATDRTTLTPDIRLDFAAPINRVSFLLEPS